MSLKRRGGGAVQDLRKKYLADGEFGQQIAKTALLQIVPEIDEKIHQIARELALGFPVVLMIIDGDVKMLDPEVISISKIAEDDVEYVWEPT